MHLGTQKYSVVFCEFCTTDFMLSFADAKTKIPLAQTGKGEGIDQ
jgi:hypothetical protein